MRKKIIAGNWKMNNTKAEAKELVKNISSLLAFSFNNKNPECDIVFCVPFTAIAAVRGELEKLSEYSCPAQCQEVFAGFSYEETLHKLFGAEFIEKFFIHIGAQNVSWADKGAFTGEISADMLLELGVEYVIVGHSERRAMFNESDQTVFLRAKQALIKGLIPIVCIGETKEQRQQNLTEKVLALQINGSLGGFSADEIEKLVIAYEPVWAIGTGLTATDGQAEDAICFIRNEIEKRFGLLVSEKVRILYGGSMNAKNAKGLLSMKNIDGGLIGGASLIAEDFVRIIESV